MGGEHPAGDLDPKTPHEQYDIPTSEAAADLTNPDMLTVGRLRPSD
jgi:hypothetical protein